MSRSTVNAWTDHKRRAERKIRVEREGALTLSTKILLKKRNATHVLSVLQILLAHMLRTSITIPNTKKDRL
jgi:hypothetical protein